MAVGFCIGTTLAFAEISNATLRILRKFEEHLTQSLSLTLTLPLPLGEVSSAARRRG